MTSNGDNTVPDLRGDPKTRDELLTELRSHLGWVSAQDHSVAVDLDQIIHSLETLALSTVQERLRIVTEERDAARADLFRIYKIVRNPMVLLEDEFKTLREAMERPSPELYRKVIELNLPLEMIEEANKAVLTAKEIVVKTNEVLSNSHSDQTDPVIGTTDGQPEGSMDV